MDGKPSMTLDEKLKETLINTEGKRIDALVDDIKAAFADAGYINWQTLPKGVYNRVGNSFTQIDGDGVMVTGNPPNVMNVIEVEHKMTGQEWYDRFEKEALIFMAYLLGYKGIPEVPVTDWLKGKTEQDIIASKIAFQLLSYAKRAAGLADA